MELVSFEWWAFFFRWMHVMSGVMWIGHLWYFNFTQAPTMPKIPIELRPAVGKFILPRSLGENPMFPSKPITSETSPELSSPIR